MKPKENKPCTCGRSSIKKCLKLCEKSERLKQNKFPKYGMGFVDNGNNRSIQFLDIQDWK